MIPRLTMLPALLLLTCFASAQNNLTARLDSLTKAYADLNYNGVVLIGNQDKIIYQKAFGYANHEQRLPMEVNTLFKTESTGKLFTTTRIMQLVGEGRISLDGTVAQYLPDWQIRNADKITVHHLLRHTSGLQSPWDHQNWNFKAPKTPAQLKQLMEEVPLAFETPGERYHYSNIGYNLLGEIISKVTGRGFEEEMRKAIFRPAGMKRIDHLHQDTIMPAGAAQPYRMVSSKQFLLMNEHVGGPASPAGGWITDAETLYKFMRHYARGKYLSPELAKQQQTANGTIDPRGDNGWMTYAYGIEYLPKDLAGSRLIFGHTGGGGGFSVDAMLEPESGYIVIFCANQWAANRGITANYFNVLFDEPLRPVKHRADVRVMDLIAEKGTAALVADHQSFFATLGESPNERLLINTAEALRELKRPADAGQVMQVVRELYPEHAYAWYLSGTIARGLKREADAKQYFTRARELAETNKDTWLLDRLKAEAGMVDGGR